jgi:hypothetical protein
VRGSCSGQTSSPVTAKVRRLERQRESGAVVKPGQVWTVEQWLTHWQENIAGPSIRYKPYIGYRTAVHRHLIPGLGAHRIDRIESEHFGRFYARMLASGLTPSRPALRADRRAPQGPAARRRARGQRMA